MTIGIGFVYAFGAALTWGLVYTVDQRILTDLSPLGLLFLYSFFTAVVLAPIVHLRGLGMADIAALDRTSMVYVGLGLVLTLIANTLILYSIKHLGASTASLVEITYPIFVVAASFVLYATVPSIPTLLGGSLILTGAFIITYYS